MSGVVKYVFGIALMFVGIYSGNLALAKAGYAIAGLGLLEEASKLFLPKPKRPRYQQDVEYHDTVSPRRIIYGQLKVGGLNTVRPTLADDQGKLLQQVLTICGHACQSVETVYFNQDEIPSSDLTAVTGTDNDGKVTYGKYQNLAWIRIYLGSDSQTVDYKMHAAIPELWTENHRGRGVTYAAITYKLDQSKYATGKPEVSFLVKGKKCYDPRLDTAPGANPTSGTYIVYTTNPALHLADYLIDANLGRGIAASKIDWVLVVAAANICDETVTVLDGATQPRYTCSLMLEASGGRVEDNIKALTSAMMGTCYRQGGKYRMYAGAALSPSFTLTEADIVGETSVRIETPMGEKYNFVRGTFIDANRQYAEVEFEPRGNAAYEVEDGDERLPKTIQLASVTDPYEAQRNAIIVLRRSRMKATMTAIFSLSAYQVRPWMVGTMTFPALGWSGKRVVCTSWRFVGDGTIEMTLQEDSSSIWADPTIASYDEPGAGGTVDEITYVPDPPTALAVQTVTDGLRFSWTLPVMLSGDVVELLEHTASTPASSATVVWSGVSSGITVPRPDGTVRYYWVRVRARNGAYSSTDPPTIGLYGEGAGTAGELIATPSTTAVSVSGSTSSLTTASVTALATGGVPTYTYSWAKLSGDTISANSASAATTTFTATSLAADETRSATFQCTVTDSDAPANTDTCDVLVMISRTTITATASPASVSGSAPSIFGIEVTSGSTTVSVTAGTPPYSYAWTKVSGDTMTPVSPLSATTTFRAKVYPSYPKTAVYRCTVTDAASVTDTADVTIELTNTYGA